MRRALPYLVAFAVPAVTLAAIYLAIGASVYAATVGGMLVGVIGAGGAALATLVRRLQRDAEEREFDRVIIELQQPGVSNTIVAPEHEGLRRMHEDLLRDDKPPERG